VAYTHSIGGQSYRFPDLKTLLAKASPARSGDGPPKMIRSASQRRWRSLIHH
jgi:ethanolamine ammonia-lyase large subunit